VGLRKEYDATNLLWLILAETGVPGALTFLGLQFAIVRMVWTTVGKLAGATRSTRPWQSEGADPRAAHPRDGGPLLEPGGDYDCLGRGGDVHLWISGCPPADARARAARRAELFAPARKAELA